MTGRGDGTTQPTRRLRACVEAWPDCQEGGYDPHCCRFPKSCSATVYDRARVADADLEPVPAPVGGDGEAREAQLALYEQWAQAGLTEPPSSGVAATGTPAEDARDGYTWVSEQCEDGLDFRCPSPEGCACWCHEERSARWRAALDNAVIPARIRAALALADAEVAAAVAVQAGETERLRAEVKAGLDTERASNATARAVIAKERASRELAEGRLAAVQPVLAKIAAKPCEAFSLLPEDNTPACFAYAETNPCDSCIAAHALAAVSGGSTTKPGDSE